jgi:hypothetical protein
MRRLRPGLWFNKIAAGVRTRMEGGKITPLTRARVALHRVIHRKGKRKKR